MVATLADQNSKMEDITEDIEVDFVMQISCYDQLLK